METGRKVSVIMVTYFKMEDNERELRRPDIHTDCNDMWAQRQDTGPYGQYVSMGGLAPAIPLIYQSASAS